MKRRRLTSGVQVSIEGGFALAADRASALGCHCFQMFAGDPRSWRRSAPDDDDVALFRRKVREGGLRPVAVHCGYLVHLASARRIVARRARAAMRSELDVASRLGAEFYVLHPGSAGGGDKGRMIRNLAERVASCPPGPGGPELLLENAASPKAVGHRFEDLANLMTLLENGGFDGTVGVCFDTAHAFGAGYDMRTEEAAGATLGELFGLFGDRVRLVHSNDSATPLGSGRDRHEHIGRGGIGASGFKALLSDGRMRALPFILETPNHAGGSDRRNLAAIRRIAGEVAKAETGRAASRRRPRRRPSPRGGRPSPASSATAALAAAAGRLRSAKPAGASRRRQSGYGASATAKEGGRRAEKKVKGRRK